MNQAAILLASVVAAAVTGGGVAFALRPAPEPAPAAISPEVQAMIGKLEDQQRALLGRLDALAATPAAVAPVAERTSVATLGDDQVAAAVERYLARRGDAEPADASGVPAGKRDPKAVFAELIGKDYWTNSKLWRRAFDDGLMDDVIAQFEAAAKAAPNDPKAHMELASAYLAYLQMDQTKWPLSMKADAEFDKVLALDDKHWDARFSKAMSYTFWPDFLGKKPEAMKHFETLIQQQEALPVDGKHAQTYLYLGNLLEQRGKTEEARAMWQKGARRHPDNEDLKKKLGGS